MSIVYTKTEERLNYLSHATGILMGLMAGYFMWRSVSPAYSSVWVAGGIMLYFSGMLSSYCASTLYHAWPAGKVWKEKLRRIDHAAIYWHIAGSYSPFTLIALREQDFWGWGLFGFVWLCAVAGTVMSLNRLKEHSNLETVCFIAMGLTILVALDPLLKTTSMETILWIIAEGVCFITGAVFYSWHQRKFMHSVFHFFVLGGSICHIMAVWHLLAPMMS